MSVEFDERVVVVTGAASGMGRATALLLAGSGARVVAVDVNEAGLAGTVAEGGERIVAEVADVSDREAVDAVVERAVRDLGRLDGMVANAGVGHGSSFVDTTEEELDSMLAVNVKGVFFCGQAAARAMVAAGSGGRIVNIASTYAEVTAPDCTAYSASKGAVRMLTKAMAVDLASHGITVNAVGPGWIRTGMNPLDDPDRVRELEATIPLGRVGVPEDVAPVIAFLLSDAAAYVTGTTTFVDGGWILQ
jgi:NAD(P)-dependent dehydrogenase (short-subunit alcohol dehydrogenase family)